MGNIESQQNEETALAALENLRKRLLDLTRRNRLINFRHTRGASLRVIDELPDQLTETLLAEKEMRFLPVPEPTREQLIEAGYIEIDKETGQEERLKKDPTAEEWARWLGLETSYEVPASLSDEPEVKHRDAAIQVLLFPYEMEVRLRNLRQKAETAIEESGANILYLAFGFLEWFDERGDGDKPRIAPLFLVPARLQKGRLNPSTRTYEYTLSYSGEDILPNLSLREKLRIDYGLALPDLDENTRPEDYFGSVLGLIKDNHPQWRLRRYITLALLNFSKLLMYLDLDPNHWPDGMHISAHPVVARFLSGYDGENGGQEAEWGFDFPDEYQIDALPDVHENYPLIDDADSSQHSALVDAVDGKNLVIEGPPGTGKSQTITNLIAAAIARGKRVLFVAEKLAALEVVKSRLDAAGLGEFCLELHSHKSQKRKVLDEVESRLKKHGHYRQPKDIDADIARYEELKDALKSHVERINKRWKKTEITLHEIFMAATRYRETLGINPEPLHPEDYSGGNFDPFRQRQVRDQIDMFSQLYQTVAKQLNGNATLQSHPWYGVHNTDLQIFDTPRIKRALEDWQASLQELVNLRPVIAEKLDCTAGEVPTNLRDFVSLREELQRLPVLKGDELLDRLPLLKGEVLEECGEYLKLFENIQLLHSRLSSEVGVEVLEDLSSVDEYLNGSGKLRQLVSEKMTLQDLSVAVRRLTQLKDQLNEVRETIDEIIAVVGEKAGKHLGLHENGLRELRTFVELVAALQPTHWQWRDTIFDNEKLDQALPEFRQQIEALRGLRDDLDGSYNLDALPKQTVLDELNTCLKAGGAFRWLKRSWRVARKKLLECAATSKVKFKTLLPLLEKVTLFVAERQQLEENELFNDLLGDHFKGMDTDIDSLDALRSWYRQVRRAYGIGFGPKVALGDAILELPADIGRAIRSLSEQGIGKRLDIFSNELTSLKEIFGPAMKSQRGADVLVGEAGLLERLLAELDSVLHSCEPLMVDDSLSLVEFGRRIEALNTFRKLVEKWTEADLDNHLFQGRLNLRPGMDGDNETALAVAQHTLAAAIDIKELSNPLITQCIDAAPDKVTFTTLNSLGSLLKKASDAQEESANAFESLMTLDRNAWRRGCGDGIEGLIERNAYALSSEQALQNWLDYVRARDQVEAIGFNALVESVEQNETPIAHVGEASLAAVYDVLAREILREQPELSRFSGHSQEALQRQFKEYDERLKRLQRERIAWRADQPEIPRGNFGGRVSSYTERSLLEHECGKKTRHIPIRQLVKRAGRALISLKPCFMMGPMSVAQYLTPGQIPFDVVVMDEASQIKPEDALGAVARGEQVVIVGDPKQLPPTSFFDRVVDDEEGDFTAIEESESILDATLHMFPQRRLRWHYRSQHESLIAFSNHSFYNSDLVLFPSPHNESDDFGIQYSRLPRGCFINRQNLEEAKVIAESVKGHFLHRPGESLGVVAMSAEQRDQIERAVEIVAKEDPTFQLALEKDQLRPDSLFVKNLENVQGDERDVIFISMTYGPQEPGSSEMFQRFGPINSDVGWRRLNVLLTRARKRMHIFSSMGSDHIKLTGNSSRGAKALRDFLAYCETGILHSTEIYSGRSPDSDFEIGVANALQREGFECKLQVGVAGFFIDIAVVDPGSPGRFLLGIECDGATYHSAKSVRDRDRLRQTILERLGWRIRRIWSTDWFKNPYAELQPIVRELHELKTERLDEQGTPSEAEGVKDIIGQVESQEAAIDPFVAEKATLEDKLLDFEIQVIQKALPETPENKRLLRPAMREAFVEYKPTSKSEYLEKMPAYLRQSTDSSEEKYLDNVLELINSSLG